MKNNKGFTFVEVVIVMGIMVILLMITSTSFFSVQQKTSLSEAAQSLITSIKQQQLKAMSGESAQGIYFDISGDFTIFTGSNYQANNPTNYLIPFGNQIVFSSTDFSGQQIIFATGSGEIGNFNGNNQIVLKNQTTNEEKIIFINKYGAITNLQ